MSQSYHYFATSAARWVASDDLHHVLKRMDADKLNYNLWFIPHPSTAKYEIEYYRPLIEGAVCIGSVKFVDGKRVDKTAKRSKTK